MPKRTDKQRATYLALLPKRTPPMDMMLTDIGSPSAPELARALGVHSRTVERWKREGQAPRPVMLALYYVTQWGRSDVHCQAHNDAKLYAGLAASLRAELDAANAEVERLRQLASASVQPTPSGPDAPLTTTDHPEKTAPVAPGQPQGSTMRPTYVRTPTDRRRQRQTDDTGFRLIRVYSADHNLHRLRHYVERLKRKDRATVVGRRVAFLGRRARRRQP